MEGVEVSQKSHFLFQNGMAFMACVSPVTPPLMPILLVRSLELLDAVSVAVAAIGLDVVDGSCRCCYVSAVHNLTQQDEDNAAVVVVVVVVADSENGTNVDYGDGFDAASAAANLQAKN
eukprot:5897599-Ditylum_brightwellii.AAC.1